VNEKSHILLIEDDPAVGRSLQTGLEQEGFKVSWQTSGREGISFAQEHQPHLIILDVRLPDGSGFDVCRQLRQHKLHQPILMLTARRDEMDKVLGLEMGADDYMTKPYGLRELISRVRALLRRAYGEFAQTGSNGQQLFLRDLLIDLDSGQVLRGQQELNLTPTEFRLLAYLGRNVGQALTRTQILASVWGYDADIESERTVNVHIRRLREKVELDPSKPTLILTVPGIGYRLAT
jgi:DNA-binding response OmpR family regulator